MEELQASETMCEDRGNLLDVVIRESKVYSRWEVGVHTHSSMRRHAVLAKRAACKHRALDDAVGLLSLGPKQLR